MQARRLAALLLVALALWPAPRPAMAQTAGEACRAGCAALPRDDRARVLACLQRCGVAVQAPLSRAATGRPVAAGPRPVQGSGYGRRVGALPASTAGDPTLAARAAGWGAIYAAQAPAGGLGVAAGSGDRMAAHGRAQAACAAGSGGRDCRMLVEFSSGCAAAARLSRGDFVAFTAAETGPTREIAETRALAACSARSRETGCRVVRSTCLG